MSSPQGSTSQLHVPRLVLSHHVHEKVHGSGPVGKFNTWLAVKITKTVGTMWIAYLFAAIALISLPAALQTGNVIVIVAWIAQTFFQLVLLAALNQDRNGSSAWGCFDQNSRSARCETTCTEGSYFTICEVATKHFTYCEAT